MGVSVNKPLPPQVQHIWGPFLIVTPASTLHNWQQECCRFMPELSVLPYWGSPHERKTIRKFWSQVGRTNTLLPSLTPHFIPHNPSLHPSTPHFIPHNPSLHPSQPLTSSLTTPHFTPHNPSLHPSQPLTSPLTTPHFTPLHCCSLLQKLLSRRKAPFHILITSYQLVVTDAKYFQRVKWQYMILDEAQAIKSSNRSGGRGGGRREGRGERRGEGGRREGRGERRGEGGRREGEERCWPAVLSRLSSAVCAGRCC